MTSQCSTRMPSRLDVCAVLDVVRRPESFSRRVVAFVEQRVKRLEHKVFVFLLDRFVRMILLLVCCAWSRCRCGTNLKQLGYTQAHGEQALRCSAIAEFSADQASLLSFNSLAPNPLQNVRRAI